MTSMSEAKELMYVPVRAYGERYVEATDFYLEEPEHANFTTLDSYIRKNYKTATAIVDLGGSTFETVVYSPLNEDDVSYVLTDSHGIPLGSQIVKPRVTPELEQYLEIVRRYLSITESISEEISTSIWPYFIEPSFKLLQSPKSNADTTKISWNDLNTFGRVLILGDPGSGKTTLLRRLTLELAERAEDGVLPMLPIYIPMRSVIEGDFGFNTVENALNALNAPTLGNLSVLLSEGGGLTLLLDGVDEVNRKFRSRIVDGVNRMAQTFPRLRMIISMRKALQVSAFDKFTVLELLPFGNSEIKRWSYKAIQGRRQWSKFYLSLLEVPELLELAKNPLMLSIATLLYVRYATIPHQRAAIFERYINALIEDWDSARGVNRSNENWTSPNRKLSALCNISYNLIENGKSTFSTEEFRSWRRDLAEEVSEEAMLSSLAEDTGLLQQTNHGQWEFVHQSIVDYLAAKYLVDTTIDLEKYFRRKLKQERFHMIWLNACGVTFEPDHLLTLMLDSRDVDPLDKAKLLCDALCQGINIAESTGNRYAKTIRNTLEQTLRYSPPTSDVSCGELLSTFPANSPSLLLSVETVDVDQSFWEDRIVPTLHALYNTKTTGACKLLQNVLSSSNNKNVKSLASILEWDGELKTQLSRSGNQLIMCLSIANLDRKAGELRP